MVIAAVNIAVVNVAGRVDRFDMVIAAAHNRAKHFAFAIGEIRTNYDIIVLGITIEVMTRNPFQARPAAAVFAVLDLNDIGFALKTLEVRLGSRITVIPVSNNIIYRAPVVETLDLVSRSRAAFDSYRLHCLIISAVVIERISYFVLARLRRGKSLAVRKRDSNVIIGHARSHVGRSDFLAILDQFCAGHDDGVALNGRTGI